METDVLWSKCFKGKRKPVHLPFLHFKGEKMKCLSFNLELKSMQAMIIKLRPIMFLWWICRKDEGMKNRLDFATCQKDLEEIRNRLNLTKFYIRSNDRGVHNYYLFLWSFTWKPHLISVGTHENYRFHYLSELLNLTLDHIKGGFTARF